MSSVVKTDRLPLFSSFVPQLTLFFFRTGGAESILINAGIDSTEDFVAIHSTKATKMLDQFYIGEVAKGDESAESAVVESHKFGLNPKKKIAFKLQAKTVLSHDTFLLDFALQSEDTILGLPTGKHVFLSGSVNGELVMRRYTPGER